MGKGVMKARVRLREGVTLQASTLEVILPDSEVCCLPAFLHGTPVAPAVPGLAGCFQNPMEFKEVPGRQLGSWGGGVQPGHCSSEPESWKMNGVGSKSESNPLASSEALLRFADPGLLVSLNISQSAPSVGFYPKLSLSGFLTPLGE